MANTCATSGGASASTNVLAITSMSSSMVTVTSVGTGFLLRLA
ncbi:MAG: hypothetical protein E7E80_10425 [Cutibacterium avidum]|nr:hypothetical protein [Cutibacterium avidum]MDU2073033.1 hypothetical protein [Cutibacterium avidum]MDU3284238.1 hypothetical protein [Cutibacterium avidum]